MTLTGESLEFINYLINQAEDSLRWRSTSLLNETTVRPTEFPGILDRDLTALTEEERLAFEITIGILCVLSLCGNFSTLYVNSKRKMRPFCRTCLISLALSDLVSTVFLTWTHFPQFIAEYVQIWLLGPFLCCFIPQVTTAAILASSMTLVGIALDRYFAVMKAVVSFWDPGVLFCFLFGFAIWLVSFIIAMPVCLIYRTISVWILTEVSSSEEDDVNETAMDWQAYNLIDGDTLETEVKPKKLVTMCVSDQQDVALYYVIVFGLIFIPCIVAFVWLNSIIAKKIWTLRHRHPQPAEPSQTNTKTTLRGGESIKSPTSYNSAREARHIRMFVVIVFLMAVFIILRLPVWIIVIMRMYGSHTKPPDWIVYFSFGILNMTSCALNPLFYTFLPETLQYLSCCKRQICLAKNKGSAKFREKNCKTELPCCICCGILCAFPSASKCCCNWHSSDVFSTKNNSPNPRNHEHDDEGVECCDASRSYGEGEDYEIRKQEISIQ